jgi:hypothetical protein
LFKSPQDATGRLPASISLISWFKAHARRISFIAFTSNCDVVTASSGACVRVWSVTGAAIGKVGKAFRRVPMGQAGGPMFSMEGMEEPEVSSRGATDDYDVGDDDAHGGPGGMSKSGVDCHQHCDDDDDGDDDDDAAADDEKPAAAFGQLASQVMKSQWQRHGKLAHRRVTYEVLACDFFV